jgi:TRAP transporter 4TM/12TM fusion protein
MQRGGYPPHMAGAVEAVASTGGQLMPPVMGAAAFLMAEFLQVPYREVVVAAVMPALLYYFALFVQADLLAGRIGIARIDDRDIPSARRVLVRGWHFLLPFVILIFALFWLNWSPERSALAGAVSLAVTGSLIGYGDKRLTARDILYALQATGLASLDLLMITAAAGFIIGVLNVSGLGFSLTLFLVQVGGDNALVLLLLSAIVCIILGMGMPTVGVYVLLAALVAPALVKVGIPAMAAHMFVMYFGMMSMITPPVALAAFAAASLARTDPMKTGWAAVRFGWVAYIIPFLFVRAPSLLLTGDIASILIAIATAFAGVWMVSAAFAGFFLRPLDMVTRIGFGIAGLLLFIPAEALHYGGLTDAGGLILGAVLVAREFLVVRRRRITA